MSVILFKEEVYQIVGASMEVYNELGPGFLEAVYQEALEIEFNERKIPFESQARIQIRYKERFLKKKYIPDFICFDEILIELKAADTLSGEHVSQLINYLAAADLKMGLLINFGCRNRLEWKRVIV